MTKEQAIDEIKRWTPILLNSGQCTEETSEAQDMAISALKGLDLPDNATNEDALNYMLRKTFPKVIFLHYHSMAQHTESIEMTDEWLKSPYKGG